MQIDIEHIKAIFGDIAKAISIKDFEHARNGLVQLMSMLPSETAKSTFEGYLESAVADAEFIAKKASKAGSWQAAIAAKRLALESRKELEERTTKQQENFDPTLMMTDEQIVSEFVGMINKMPDAVLERIDRVLEMRRRPTPQFTVFAGGAE